MHGAKLMTLIEKGYNFVPLLPLRDLRADCDNFTGAIRACCYAEFTSKGICSLFNKNQQAGTPKFFSALGFYE